MSHWFQRKGMNVNKRQKKVSELARELFPEDQKGFWIPMGLTHTYTPHLQV